MRRASIQGAIVALGGVVILSMLSGDYYSAIFVLSVSFAFVTLGMAVQVGYANQVVLSQSVFMGLGAYGTAVLNTKYGWTVPAAIAAMVGISALLAVVVGRLLTRVEGFALALVTLFFAVVVANLVTYSAFLGGFNGLGGIGPIVARATTQDTAFWSGIAAVLVLGLCVGLCVRVVRSGIGLELAVLGADERMAQSLGVLTRRRKVELFVLGSTLAALGGGFFAGTQSYVSIGSFDQTAQLTLLIMLFLGGRRSIWGALLGTIGIELLSGTSNFVATNLLIIEGVLFTVILLVAPDGLISLPARGLRALARAGVTFGRAVPGADPPAAAAAPGLATPALAQRAGADGVEAADGVADLRGVDTPGGRTDGGDPDGWTLRCVGLTKRFGGVQATDDVSLEIGGRGVHAIVGPNGAGKSTLFELIAGGLDADGGQVWFGDRDVSRLGAAERAGLGLARTFQAVRLVDALSALDNVAVGALPSHRTTMFRALVGDERGRARVRAREALAAFGIEALADRRPAELTLEAQRLVELARAMVARPSVLLLDEPASGLSVEQRERLAVTLEALGRRMTVVLVEHDLELVASVSQRVYALIDGRIVYQGGPDGFRRDPAVRSRLLGLGADDVPDRQLRPEDAVRT